MHDAIVLGEGHFRYRLVPDWGVLGTDTPVANCHGIVCDREERIILLTDHVKNNVIIYDRAGRLIDKWGTAFPGAHGLSLVDEGSRQVLYITDTQLHKVFKTTLDGEILNEWGWPQGAPQYTAAEQYAPSWTLHSASDGFYVLDGYGRDYILHYSADGKLRRIFGGKEGGIEHWGPHGGMMLQETAELLIAMSDQKHLLRLACDGRKLARIDLPGGNPRSVRFHNGHLYVVHLADNWPQDRSSRGFVSILDSNFLVVSNVGGTPPHYSDDGQLGVMQHQTETFMHPHDIAIDAAGDLYVAQFASGNTYPLKLERI